MIPILEGNICQFRGETNVFVNLWGEGNVKIIRGRRKMSVRKSET